jgi:hypothetical protein
MRKIWINLPFFFILLSGMACGSLPQTKTADFSLYYYWNVGALPPEEHYEIELEINPDRSATTTVQVGYAEFGAQRTSFEFVIPEEQWNSFYQWLVENEILEHDWSHPGYALLGANETAVKFQVNGSTYEIPSQSHLSAEDRDLFARVQNEIERLIPAEIWEKIEITTP